MSLRTNRPNKPANAHCNSIPSWAKTHIGPTLPATSLTENFGDESGRAPNTSAISTAA